MISGMYLGEIARQVIMDLVDRKLIFQTTVSDELKTKGSFQTMFVSEVER